jgi:hypothetical protein
MRSNSERIQEISPRSKSMILKFEAFTSVLIGVNGAWGLVIEQKHRNIY